LKKISTESPSEKFDGQPIPRLQELRTTTSAANKPTLAKEFLRLLLDINYKLWREINIILSTYQTIVLDSIV
jgi:hypothetical protein